MDLKDGTFQVEVLGPGGVKHAVTTARGTSDDRGTFARTDAPGEYPGLSAMFSGDGFSDMRFIAKAVPAGDFNAWVRQVGSAGAALDDASYAALAKPSRAVTPTTYRSVAPKLFDRIIEQTLSGSPVPPVHATHAGGGTAGAGAGAAWSPPLQQAGG